MKKFFLFLLVVSAAVMLAGPAPCRDGVVVKSIHVEKMHETDTSGDLVYLRVKVDVENHTDQYEVTVTIKALDAEDKVVSTLSVIGDAQPRGHGYIEGHATMSKSVYNKIQRWVGE